MLGTRSMAVPSSATSRAVAVAGSGSDASSQNGSNGSTGPGPSSVGAVPSAVPVRTAVNGTESEQPMHDGFTRPAAVPPREPASSTVTVKVSYWIETAGLQSNDCPPTANSALEAIVLPPIAAARTLPDPLPPAMTIPWSALAIRVKVLLEGRELPPAELLVVVSVATTSNARQPPASAGPTTEPAAGVSGFAPHPTAHVTISEASPVPTIHRC